MFVPIIAGIVTVVGVVSLVISSLVHASAASDLAFNAAAVCLVGGPLIFLFYVIIGLCIEFIEFASTNQKPEIRISARVPSLDLPLAPLSHVAFDEGLPEGLRRERKGPLNPSTGRANKI
jgi:hypothetical protein